MSNLIKFDPFVELNALHRQFFGDDQMTALKNIAVPTTDVYINDNKELIVEAHLPNFNRDNINVHIENGVLVIQAERHEKEEDKSKKYVVRKVAAAFIAVFSCPNVPTATP